jgi:hypothetical protein
VSEPILGHVSWSPDFKDRPMNIRPDMLAGLIANGTVQFMPKKPDVVEVSVETPLVETEETFIRLLPGPLNVGVEVQFTYMNWKGEVSERRAVFNGLAWGSSRWHRTPQLLLEGYDIDKKAPRTYAAKDVSNLRLL